MISPVFFDHRAFVQITPLLILIYQSINVQVLHPPEVPVIVALPEHHHALLHNVTQQDAHIPGVTRRVELVRLGLDTLCEL